VAWDWFRKRGL